MQDFGPYSVLYMIILLQKPWRDRGVGKEKETGKTSRYLENSVGFRRVCYFFSFSLSLILHFISIPEEQ